ncbi:MAG: DUF3445 domain-containing protein [Acidimicrobiales bacterium]|nr:DUF3445 domain-containing protein [Acidimicrobiales bacterium]
MPLSFPEVVDHPILSPPFRWRMGVRSLGAPEWLQPDDRRADDLARKTATLAEPGSDGLRFVPGSEPAAQEVLDLVAADLARRGLALSTIGTHPIDIAGRSVQEDLCLLERDDTAWRLTAGSVCFPTRWSLADKIGGTLAAIHGPVPGYAEQLSDRVDRFFDRMTPGAIAYRLNWSLVGDSARRLPAADRQAPDRLPADPATQLFLRVERQTLRRLEHHTAIVFGIRIHVWSLGEVLADLPPAALAGELLSAPLDVARYKNLDGLRRELARWIDAGGEAV